MAIKTYTIKYEHDSKTWGPLTVSARIVNQVDKKVEKLYEQVLVEDASSSDYPALSNSVLLVENTEVVAQIESGDVAKIHLRLNAGDPNLKRVLAQNSKFKLKVTLRPEPNKGTGKPSKPGPPVEGFTEILVELPQIWDLTLRKTLWHDAGVIDLNTVEGVDKARLQKIGDWGGKLLLQPKGLLVEENGNKIHSQKTIAHAGECVLDRGEGQLIKGEWDKTKKGYLFLIPPSQKGEPPAGAGEDQMTIEPALEPEQGWKTQLRRLLTAARKLTTILRSDINQPAGLFTAGCLDHLAEKEEKTLVDRRKELNIWLLNIANYVVYMEQASELFARALKLFDQAFKRFTDNLVNALIETIFAIFDLLNYVFKSATKSAKDALKTSTKEMVEDAAQESIEKLAREADTLARTVRSTREGIDSLDDQLASAWRGWPDAAELADPSPAVLRRMDDVMANATNLQRQRGELFEAYTRQQKELLDRQANRAIAQEVKEKAAKATEKEFLEEIRQKALRLGDDPQIRLLVEQMKKTGSEDVSLLLRWQSQMRQTLGGMPRTQATANARARLVRMMSQVDTHVESIRNLTLIDFNKNVWADHLEKQPLGERLKKVSEESKKAKTAAEAIRYQNVAWEHYKGFFSPLWWFMDWSLAQILWLHDLAREWVPGLARAEALLGYAVDTVLGFVMQALNALIDFANSHHWKRSCISSELRGRGKQSALSVGVSSAFFGFPKSTLKIVDQLKPRTVVASSPSGSRDQMNQTKKRLKAFADGGYQQEKATQVTQSRVAFASLLRQALDASLLEQKAPEHVGKATFDGVWRALIGPMVQYEKAFDATGQQGTDYMWSIGRFATGSSFQDWDGMVEWIAWALAWGLRLGGLLAIFTGVGAAAVPLAFSAAQFTEWLAAALRPALAAFGTMPDVIALQADVVVAAALGYEAAVKGGVDLDGAVVASYFIE